MRIYCDTTVMPFLTKEQVENIISSGNILVFANTVIDVSLFRDNLVWFDELLHSGKVIVEFWNTLDEMVSKPFYWSSAQITTPAYNSFREAANHLPHTNAVNRLAELINRYGIPKGQWPMGSWAPPAPIDPADAAILGVDPATATRTDILMAAKSTNNMAVYDKYNIGYNKGLAQQHKCDAIIKSDGTFDVI